jgi:hypothetical protein
LVVPAALNVNDFSAVREPERVTVKVNDWPSITESALAVSGLVGLFHKPLIQLHILSYAEPKSRTSGNHPVSI